MTGYIYAPQFGVSVNAPNAGMANGSMENGKGGTEPFSVLGSARKELSPKPPFPRSTTPPRSPLAPVLHRFNIHWLSTGNTERKL